MNRETRMLVYGIMLMAVALASDVVSLGEFNLLYEISEFLFFAGLLVGAVGAFSKTKARP